MNYNTIDWYEFILKNHFVERKIQPPPFFTRSFVYFKLPTTSFPPITSRDKKVFEAKHKIYKQIHTMATSQLINIICDTSFIHLSSTS